MCSKGGQACCAVKSNQPELLKSCQVVANSTLSETYQDLDKKNGYPLIRKTEVFRIPRRNARSFWGLFTHVVKTTRVFHDEAEVVYHVLTHHRSARLAAALVRGHWGIENRCHWVRDCIFKEDASRAHPVVSLLLTTGINRLANRQLKATKALAETLQWDLHALVACVA